LTTPHHATTQHNTTQHTPPHHTTPHTHTHTHTPHHTTPHHTASHHTTPHHTTPLLVHSPNFLPPPHPPAQPPSLTVVPSYPIPIALVTLITRGKSTSLHPHVWKSSTRSKHGASLQVCIRIFENPVPDQNTGQVYKSASAFLCAKGPQLRTRPLRAQT
jgi:hypothetical protein